MNNDKENLLKEFLFDDDMEFDYQFTMCMGMYCYLKKIICLLKKIDKKLQIKIDLETPQPEVDCECEIEGIGRGDLAGQGLDGQLIISVCEDCTIEGSEFTYNRINQQTGNIVKQAESLTFEQVDCDLNEDGDGTVILTGTALVSNPQMSEDFTLTLNVEGGIVTSFIIDTQSINNEEIEIDEGEITVTPCNGTSG